MAGSKLTPTEVLLTPKEVAAMLQVSVRTVQRWHEAEEMPQARRLGRLLRWRPDVIREWIDGGRRRRAG
jgi:excisionase family DNA binding protein